MDPYYSVKTFTVKMSKNEDLPQDGTMIADNPMESEQLIQIDAHDLLHYPS